MTKPKSTTRSYRATAILDLRGVSEAPETIIEKLKDTFKAVGGKVGEVTNLGQRDFSYVIDRKFPSGIYVRFDVSGAATLPLAFQEKVRLDRTVHRVLFQSR